LEIFLNLSGAVIGVVGLVYAVIANRKNAKLEAFVQLGLENLVDDVEEIKKNAKLAYSHLDPIRRFLEDPSPSGKLADVLDHMTWLHGDVTAAERLLSRLIKDIVSLRRGLYGSKIQGPISAETQAETRVAGKGM